MSRGAVVQLTASAEPQVQLEIEQLATDELGRRKLNPRRPNSGMMRGF